MTLEQRRVVPPSWGMSQKSALFLLRTVWPDVPDVEIVKAAMVCAQYGLNPLMRHVSFLKFVNHKTGDITWTAVLGIQASRLIAAKGGARRYGYLDDTPRAMTEDEEIRINGQADATRVWSITRIRDSEGYIYTGVGSWPKADHAYGEDKGNTPRNMANIRSERQALGRMAPGELPDIEISDESYTAQPTAAAFEDGKREFQRETQKQIDEHWPAAPNTMRNKLPEFTNGLQLVNYALAHGYKIDVILEKLSINQPTEITDLKAATRILFP